MAAVGKLFSESWALLLLTSLAAGCMEEVVPSSYAVENQIGASESALQALSNGTAAFMYDYAYFNDHPQQEFGYPAMMIIRDAMTDCPYVSTSYNHFNSYWCSLVDFTTLRGRQPWRYYYRLILNANKALAAIGDPATASENVQVIYANLLVYRAMAYMDLARMYEYKRTGVAALDGRAGANGVYGLTTVVVDENFDPACAFDNPRAPFHKMYRLIMTDLNRAEKYLKERPRSNKVRADVSVVHAFKARLWLEIATRFQKYPADLDVCLAHEDDGKLAVYDKLGITSAEECWLEAAGYAGRVMELYTPLTREQWHSTTAGFNDANADSWVFAISVSSPDAIHSRVDNFLSNCVTEYSRGYSRSQYGCYRMIDKNLYDRIGEGDWRKATWIDPADEAKKPTPAKYRTLLSADEWALRKAFTGFKFRPNEGDVSDDWLNALQVDYPLIRVEEMYFIEAEAKAYTEGLASGIAALSAFMNTFRYTDGSYAIEASEMEDVDDFVDNHLITQKRIELWGEGLAFFDIKRRELALVRGYAGTNWLADNRVNSLRGYTPSWLNMYIPNESEGVMNEAIVLNPNPSVIESYGRWKE